ncbi:extended synaptotagmin-3 isoform X13 [Manis pentadactyla]|uniref:extended synaptotagmin-3 isoform X13 n=1 Tax=Manis pentadactyla TaxID=143292 RepID=UPI00255C733A|nr:extended synaptotagmin-3 isoform X13 [Manis pentadactyla]
MQAGEPCAPGAQGNQRAPRPKPRLSSQLLPEFYTFVARVLFYLAPVYLAGYLGLSITWLLLGALLWLWWRRNRRGKLGRLEAAFEFLDNERQFISRELRGQHLPAWIHFPDVERVEWANKIISQTWPYLSMIMENKVREKLEPKIREKSAHLRTFAFTKLYFGQKVGSTVSRHTLTSTTGDGWCWTCRYATGHTSDHPGAPPGGQALRGSRDHVLPSKAAPADQLDRPDQPAGRTRHQFIVYEVPGQDLEVDLYDEDPDKDDFLGSLQICLGDVMTNRAVDEWFVLNDTTSGRLHLRLEWLSLITDPDALAEDQSGSSTAILVVFLESACNLPRNAFDYLNGEYRAKKLSRFTKNKVSRDPSSYVKVSVGKKTHMSKTCPHSKDPVWSQVFSFFVQDVAAEQLHLEVLDDDQECALGVLELPLCQMLRCTDLTLEQRFRLDHSGLDSLISMRLVLRFLRVEEREMGSPYTGSEALKKGPLFIKKVDINQGSKAPHQGEGPADLPGPLPPASDTKDASRSATTATNATTVATKPIPQEAGPEPKGKDSAKGFCEPVVEKRSSSTVFLTVPGLHSPGPIKSPRPVKCPASPFAWPPKRLAPSMSSLNSLASSCFDLTDTSLNNEGGELRQQGLGEIQLTVRYVCLRRCLSVLINGCRNLMPCTSSGADPYVRVYLLPDRKWACRKKTSVKRKTLEPLFDETFEFFAPMEEVKKRSLDVAVKNNRPLGSHRRKELGKVLIDLSKEDLIKGFSQWYELTPDGQPRN